MRPLARDEVDILVRETKFKLPDFKFDEISSDESRTVTSCSENYGFAINKKIVSEKISQEKMTEKTTAVLFIKGSWSVKSEYLLKTDSGEELIKVFPINLTLSNFRYREIANKLLAKKKVELFPGLDEEYLYEALIDTSENLFYQDWQGLKTKPLIFYVSFDDEGKFKIVE